MKAKSNTDNAQDFFPLVGITFTDVIKVIGVKQGYCRNQRWYQVMKRTIICQLNTTIL